MSNELDALIVRNLSELHEAAVQLATLDIRIMKAIDATVNDWVSRNGWSGISEIHNGSNRLWLAPEGWSDSKCSGNHLLYFLIHWTEGVSEDVFNLISLTNSGDQRLGLRLAYDTINARPFKKLFKEFLADNSNLPLEGSDFFLPLAVDREALAQAVEGGAIDDALQPVRDTLERLPELAARLEPLRRKISDEGG